MSQQYFFTTTGLTSEVVIEDLGELTYTHPTTKIPMLGTEGFLTREELLNSNSLQELMDRGEIIIEGDFGIVRQLNPEIRTVKILETSEDPNEKVTGLFKARGFKFDIPEGVQKTFYDLIVPYDISILSVEFFPTLDMDGDNVSVIISPDTIVGIIEEEVLTGSTSIKVSSTAFNYLVEGTLLQINDEDVGYVLTRDLENNVLNFQNPVTNDYPVGTPVRLSVESINQIHLKGENIRYEIGSTKIGSSFLKANSIIRLFYDNISGTSHEFAGYIEYLY